MGIQIKLMFLEEGV